MGENKGVSSLFRLLNSAASTYTTTIFSIDKNTTIKCDQFKSCKQIKIKISNKYLQYALAQANYLFLNVQFLYWGLTLSSPPNLIYCSSSLPMPAAYLLKKFYNIKMIARVYGTFLFPILNSKTSLLKKYQEVLGFIIPADHYIITDDGTSGDQVAAHFKIPSDSISFWRNGVDSLPFMTSEFETIRCQERKKLNIHNDSLILLAYSRFASWKRVDRIILAMNMITEKNIHLLIAGDGEMMESYKALAQNSNIVFLGAQTNDEIKRLLIASDIFISMYDLSNLGNPLLEALKAGKAIITYDIGDTRKVFNGKNLILLPQQKEDSLLKELRDAILNLFLNPKLIKDLEKEAAHYSQNELYSWNERIQKELDVFNKFV